MTDTSGLTIFDIAYSEAQADARDRRSIEHALTLYDNVFTALTVETMRLRQGDDGSDVKAVRERIVGLEKAMQSVLDIQARLIKRVESLAKGVSEAGGLDFEAAKREVKSRLDRLAKCRHEDGFS